MAGFKIGPYLFVICSGHEAPGVVYDTVFNREKTFLDPSFGPIEKLAMANGVNEKA